MSGNDPAVFHRLWGERKPRVAYYAKDFGDYALMLVLAASLAAVAYGVAHPVAVSAYVLCAFALASFAVRHGVELAVPLIFRRPQDLLYMVAYKILNLRPFYLIALALLVLENVFILYTPGLPHHTDGMRTAALVAFYVHLLTISAYRTVILVAHLARREHVREVLRQTPWKRVIHERTNMTLEIVHAYATGLLSHVLLIAPWYLVIRYVDFSLVLLPFTIAAGVVIHVKWMNVYNAWFYRDHWLGHNSELEFLYLHGSHHDAIPSALIAVSDSGFIEGFLRFAVSSPVAFYNPFLAFLIYMYDVKSDVDLHQYIPGVYPRLSRRMLEVFQHSTHHYGRLDPYGIAMKIDQPGIPDEYRRRFARFPATMVNSFVLDEELNGSEWENPTHLQTLSLWDRYEEPAAAMPVTAQP